MLHLLKEVCSVMEAYYLFNFRDEEADEINKCFAVFDFLALSYFHVDKREIQRSAKTWQKPPEAESNKPEASETLMAVQELTATPARKSLASATEVHRSARPQSTQGQMSVSRVSPSSTQSQMSLSRVLTCSSHH